MNLPLITSVIAIVVAQLLKYPIALLSRGKAKLNLITATGGMPSSHSAAVSSLITALALEYGVDSPYVAIATVFGMIVMFDSKGVRRQSGEQGIVIDSLVQQSNPPLTLRNTSSSYEELIVTKYLGHKPTEVIVGTLLGFAIAIICRTLFVWLNS